MERFKRKNVNKRASDRKKCYMFGGVLVIFIAMILMLVIDAQNISTVLPWISDINFDLFSGIAGIVITLSIFILTFIIHDYVDLDEKLKEKYLAASYVCEIMANSYYTLGDKDFISEMNKFKYTKHGSLIDSEALHTLQRLPFLHYTQMIENYMRDNMLPYGLINAYCVSKQLFSRYVYLYTANAPKKQLKSLKDNLCKCHDNTIDELLNLYKDLDIEQNKPKLVRIKDG